jgi:TrmH family RNA methyltransferase
MQAHPWMPPHDHRRNSDVINARIRQAQRLLRDRQERERTGLFTLEGLRPIVQAFEHDFDIEALIVAPELLENPLGRSLARQGRRAGIPCSEVTAERFRSLSLAEEPQGIAGVARQRWEPLSRASPAAGLCWVALETVQSSGNLGTILRTSEAVGGAGIILLGGAIDPYHPAVVRASMGALCAQRFVRTTPAALAAWKREHGCVLVGTSPGATTDYRAVKYEPPVVLCMGWERQGLSPGLRALCDVMVRIPMVGDSNSLNLAVATGVVLYEIFNQSYTR